MESYEDDEETQASFCRFLDDNFKLPISAYAPDCVPKVEIKERLYSERRYEEAKPYLEAVMKHSEDDVAKVISAEYLYKINGDFGNRDEEAGFAKYLADNKKLNEADKALVSELNYVYEANRHRDEKRASAWQITLVISIIIAVGLIILFAYGYNKRMRIANVSTTETSNNEEEQENEVVERSFYDEPICKEILGMVCYIPINTRTNYSDYPNVKLNNDMIVELGKAVDKHFPCLKYALNSTGVSLKNSDMLLLHLYLVGLNPIQIALLRQCHYSTVSRQVSQLKEKLSVEGDLGSFIKNHAIS